MTISHLQSLTLVLAFWVVAYLKLNCSITYIIYQFERAFSVAAPELWNNLPEDIKSANSIDDFKHKLKTFLFMRAYES